MTRDRILLLAIAASYLLAGFAEPFSDRPNEMFSGFAVIHSFVILVLVFFWCKADAAARQIPLPVGAAFLAALIPPVGVPIYFFRAQPWRNALLLTVYALAFQVFLYLLFWIGNTITDRIRA